ncbi:MAG: hypothetical protein IPM16_21345 [Chloroflexi bacterium]|nr:hypothetical protein [Chloroflexota bacterium]
MASTTTTTPEAAALAQVRTGRPAVSLRFDWLMAMLSALFLAGLWVDGWAHFHSRVDDSFFTPWHLVFYGMFVVNAIVLARTQLRGVGQGYPFARAMPFGYGLSLVSVLVFALGGAGDMVWHELFGIESGAEALTSPTHLILGAGMLLMFAGPLRSALGRARAGAALTGWRELGPAIVSVTLLLTLLMFFTSYSHPITAPVAYLNPNIPGPLDLTDFGVTSVILQAAVLTGFWAVLAARWTLPRGALTFLVMVSSGLLTILVDVYILLPGFLIAVVLVEIVVARLKVAPDRPNAMLLVGGLLPMLHYLAYFVTMSFVTGVRWNVHVWAGAIVLAGAAGLLVVYLINAVRDQKALS